MLWPVYSSVVHRRYNATFHRPPSHALCCQEAVNAEGQRPVDCTSDQGARTRPHRACWPSTAREYEYECVIGSFAVVKLWSHCYHTSQISLL